MTRGFILPLGIGIDTTGFILPLGGSDAISVRGGPCCRGALEQDRLLGILWRAHVVYSLIGSAMSEMSDTSKTDATSASRPLPEATQHKLTSLVERSQKVMAHAWMIRTFVKHSDEVDDFPELNEMARTIFDVFRAVETQVGDPAGYFRTVRKKIGKLRSAAEEFEKNAWHASTHTNFQQAVISAKFVGEQLQELVAEAAVLLPRPVPPKFTLPTGGRPAPTPVSDAQFNEEVPSGDPAE